MVATHSIRPLLRWLPFQFGKGKLAHYLLQPTEIPTTDVRTKSGVLVRTAQDKMYRDIYLYGEYEQNLTARIRDVVKPGFRSKLRLLLGAAGYASRHQGVCTRV
jgi:hypothetical protein